MNNANILFYVSLSVIFPLLVSIIRFKRLSKDNILFIILLALGCINEILFYNLHSLYVKNIITNLYLLVEFILLAIQFYYWEIIAHKLRLVGILLLAIIVYAFTVYQYKGLQIFNSYFVIFDSFLIVFLILDYFNKKLFKWNSYILDYKMLICIALFIFYLQSILIEAFFAYGINLSEAFQVNIQYIRSLTNFIMNITFGFALLWIPKKQIYI